MHQRRLFRSLAATAAIAFTAVVAAIVPSSPAQAASIGPYYLKPLSNSTLCVQPQSENLANSTKLELVTCRNVGAQKWWIRDSLALGGDNKLIVNGASHTCMNVKDAGGSESPVLIYTCSDSISTRNNDIFKLTYWDYNLNPNLKYLVPQHALPGNVKPEVFSGGVLGSDLITRDYPEGRGHAWIFVSAPS